MFSTRISINTKEISLTTEVYLVLVDLRGEKDTKEIISHLSAGYPFPKVRHCPVVFVLRLGTLKPIFDVGGVYTLLSLF